MARKGWSSVRHKVTVIYFKIGFSKLKKKFGCVEIISIMRTRNCWYLLGIYQLNLSSLKRFIGKYYVINLVLQVENLLDIFIFVNFLLSRFFVTSSELRNYTPVATAVCYSVTVTRDCVCILFTYKNVDRLYAGSETCLKQYVVYWIDRDFKDYMLSKKCEISLKKLL